MDKLIPYEKLSKKKQRERNKAKRGNWGAVNPVTRKPVNPKAYNRQKARRWKFDPTKRAFSSFMVEDVGFELRRSVQFNEMRFLSDSEKNDSY